MSCWLCPVICSLLSAGVPVEPRDQEPVATVTVHEIQSSLIPGRDLNSRQLRIAVQVSIKNESKAVLKVAPEQFRFLSDGQPSAVEKADPNDLLEPATLQPMEECKGWIGSSGMTFNGEEMPLKLQWSPGDTAGGEAEKKDVQRLDDVVETDLNQQIRRLNAYEKKLIGPDGELLVISVHRNLDILAVWALGEEMEQLSSHGVERVLFVPASGAKPVAMDEFSEWLSKMAGNAVAAAQSIPTPQPKAGVTFRHLSLAEFRETTGRAFRSGRRGVPRYSTVDDAVCAALTPVYRFAPVEQAIADLRSPNLGVRRAAMAGAVDRLTAEQAGAILEQARSASESVQLEIASYLNLIPGAASVDALRDMCLGENRKVAAAALRSLARSREDAAVAAMAEIWQTGQATPSLQSETVKAIVEASDDRWAPLVADYVSVFLRQATQPDGATVPAESISSALTFLEMQKDTGTLSEVRRELLNIQNPGIQDLFLDYLMHSADGGNENVIRKCVTTRLNDGEISSSVARAASNYRDPAWTEALLAGFNQSRDDTQSSQFLDAVLECASDEQLDGIVANIEQFQANHRPVLLQYLARVNHPGWRKLAGELISHANRRSSEIVQLLAQDASEESLLILRERLESYVKDLEGAPDASLEGQQFFQTLAVHLSMFVHPECRRTINRMARNSNVYVSERATRLKADAFRRSPAFRLMVAESRMRRDGNAEEANQLLSECTETDPLLPEVYVRRASTEMHAGSFEKSMEDLKTADRLSPEDIEVQSMIALVMVRMDDIDKGLAYAEEVIALAPKDWTSLYNGACTFARATESQVPDAESKESYAKRAIELLRLTAELKFSDADHMLVDPDLNSLHDHPEWDDVVALVNANKEAAAGNP